MALAGIPDLFTQAHEAAHGVQQEALGGLASNFAHEDALSREFAVPKSRGIIEKLDELRKK